MRVYTAMCQGVKNKSLNERIWLDARKLKHEPK